MIPPEPARNGSIRRAGRGAVRLRLPASRSRVPLQCFRATSVARRRAGGGVGPDRGTTFRKSCDQLSRPLPASSTGAGSSKRVTGRADFFPSRVFYPSHSRHKAGAKQIRLSRGRVPPAITMAFRAPRLSCRAKRQRNVTTVRLGHHTSVTRWHRSAVLVNSAVSTDSQLRTDLFSRSLRMARSRIWIIPTRRPPGAGLTGGVRGPRG